MNKEQIGGTLPGADHEEFYRFFIGQLVRRAAGTLTDVKMTVDGSGGLHFQRALKRHLNCELHGRITGFRLVDSRRDDFIQLADMCVGAIARAFRTHNRSDRWLQMLGPRIEDIWQFR